MNRAYTTTFFFLWGMLGWAYALYGSHALMHWIQDDRVLWADEIVQIWTRFGEGYPALLALGALAWLYRGTTSLRPVLRAFLYTILLAYLIPQGLKWIFSEAPRPWKVFPSVQDLPGLTRSFAKSFPSGHTAFAVAWTAAWSTLAPAKFKASIGLCLIAFGVGYSRMHLHMHWLHDVVAGGLIGFFCAYAGIRLSGFTQTS